jgi:hypothetical protein
VLQVLLAMMFLAIIGGSGGWLAAQRQKQHHTAAVVATSPPASPSPNPSPSPSTPDRCLPQTEEAANVSPLFLVLYIRTAKSEVWICESSAGTLYYQGHRGKPGDPLVEGKTSLFVPNVVRNGDGFIATNTDSNGTTQYFVTKDRLVTVPGQPEAVVESRP